ncbi:MAG: hypothetical protein QOC66_496, partial [Pseudonocardiales bacterium]|nr:hypothetical protein [Pseudonocardiales bacterium]
APRADRCCEGVGAQLNVVQQPRVGHHTIIAVRAVGTRAWSGTACGAVGPRRRRAQAKRQVRLARWFATYAGISSLAIDGPFHGDRAVPGDGPLDYRSRVVDSGAYRAHNSMRQDWLDAVNLAEQAGWVDPLLGRFLSVDPLLDTKDAQSINGYAYANNDPINGSDTAGTGLVGVVILLG